MVCGTLVLPADEAVHDRRAPFQNVPVALAHQHLGGAVPPVPGLYANAQTMDRIGAVLRPRGTAALRALGRDPVAALVGRYPVSGLADCGQRTVAGGGTSVAPPFGGGLSSVRVGFADRDRSRFEI